MSRLLLYIAIEASAVTVLVGVWYRSSGDEATDIQAIDGGTCVAGQLAVVPIIVDRPGWSLMDFQGSCGCMALESQTGPVTLPTVLSSENDRFFVRIDTTGRSAKAVYTGVLRFEKDGRSAWSRFRYELDVVPAWTVEPQLLVGEGQTDSQIHEFRVAIFGRADEYAVPVDRVEVSDRERIEATIVNAETVIPLTDDATGERMNGTGVLSIARSKNGYRHQYNLLLKCRPPTTNLTDHVSVVGSDSNVRLTIPLTWKMPADIKYKPTAIVVPESESSTTRSLWIEHEVEDVVHLHEEYNDLAPTCVTTDLGAGRRRTEVRLILPPRSSGVPKQICFHCRDREYCVPIEYLPGSP